MSAPPIPACSCTRALITNAGAKEIMLPANKPILNAGLIEN